jgi:hypothetical protein
VWDTDANGNVTIDPVGAVSGDSAVLAALERSFHQDLNGDTMIGNPSIAITVESSGATSLVLTGNTYVLEPNGTSNGPALKYDGAAWTDGEWGGWTPVGAEVTANGHEVAFNLQGTNLYTVWNADSNGNLTTVATGNVTAGSPALQAVETNFHQDLDGDGIIGDPSIPVAIESAGSTSLTQINGNFFLYANGTTVGPELKYDGAAWTKGEWGGWMPIGAETTGAGYDVAFKLAGSDLYTVWSTDANGNLTGNSLGGVPGSNASLQSLETVFHQDLNGDGVIGSAGHAAPAAVAAPVTAPVPANGVLSGGAATDTFVFNAHVGNDTATAFQPGADQVDPGPTPSASVVDALAHTADDVAGGVVVTVVDAQSITPNNVLMLVSQQHASDFHLI